MAPAWHRHCVDAGSQGVVAHATVGDHEHLVAAALSARHSRHVLIPDTALPGISNFIYFQSGICSPWASLTVSAVVMVVRAVGEELTSFLLAPPGPLSASGSKQASLRTADPARVVVLRYHVAWAAFSDHAGLKIIVKGHNKPIRYLLAHRPLDITRKIAALRAAFSSAATVGPFGPT